MPALLPFRRRPHDCEWIGGRYTLPQAFREGDDLAYPEVDLWLELPRGVLVGTRIGDPRKEVPFRQTLEEAMQQPAEGSPRRPARIRVPEQRLADALRDAVDSDISIVVAPVPELDAAFADLTSALAADHPVASYLGGGTISPAVVAELFAAASILFRMAPWRRVAEEQLLRVDIPSLGVDGECLSIIGGAGESFGLLLFRSLEAYDAFAAGPPPPPPPTKNRARRETALLSLSFDRKKDLPPSLLQEIKKHGWPVAGPKAYPVVFSVDSDSVPQPMSERDFRIITASTLAFGAFLARHGDLFEADDPEPVCESFSGDDEVTVTLTAPYGAKELFDVEGFFASEEPPRRDRETIHERDVRLVRAIAQFASDTFGPKWLGKVGNDVEADEALLQLFLPWVAWTAMAGGRRIADLYLDQNEARLSVEERAWFAAQGHAWLGILEVTAVKPGRIDVRDLLTGERRSVAESLGSRTLVARDTLLARVIDFDGRSLFAGMYGRSLPPGEAAKVVREVRLKLRVRKGDVPVERLREPKIGRFMIDRWQDAVDDFDERRSKPPVLQNTDGDPLLFVTESFSFDATVRREIEGRIESMDDLDGVQRRKNESTFVFARPADRTVTGRVIVGRDSLRIETNSERRADALRQRVRDACGAMLRDAGRKTEEAPSLQSALHKPMTPAPAKLPPELKLLRDVKEQHYLEWIDKPVPALGGKTPRAAARAPRSRAKLDLLLRDLENHESRLPERERFDFGLIRRKLGMED